MDKLLLTGIIIITIILGLLAGVIVGYCVIHIKKFWLNRKYKKSVLPYYGLPCSIKLQDKDIIELEMLPDNYFSFGRMSESWQFTYDDEEDDDDENNLFSANYKITKESSAGIEKKENVMNQEKWIGDFKSGQSFL